MPVIGGRASSSSDLRRVLSRSCAQLFKLLALAGVIWSVVTLPTFWSAIPTKEMAARVLADDRFRPELLTRILAAMDAYPSPKLQRSDLPREKALIQLRMADQYLARKDADQIDSAATAASENLVFALAANPSDSFLWLLLYDLEVKRKGFSPAMVGFLDQSYATAGLEAWIALRRNRIGLAAFRVLDDRQQQRVVSEFVALVDAGFIDDAVMTLRDIEPSQREMLMGNLERADLVARETLARRLQREGLKAVVPGVANEERLWR